MSARRPHAPEIVLAAAMIASGVMLLGFTSHITFVADEWDLLLLRPGWDIDQFLDPFHEHTVMAPALSYKVLQTVFGMDSARPMQVAAIGTFLLAAGLFFVYVRRRVGAWAAVIMTVVVLFLGGAFEDLVWAFQIGYFGSLAAGIGALIMLDRDDHRGDVCATVLLVLSLSFSSLGIPFVAAVVVEWLLNPRDRRRRVFVPGTAILFFAAWWLGWGRQAESAFSLANLPDLPAYVFNAVGAGFTTLAGLATGDGSEPDQPNLIWGKILFVVAAILAGWRLMRQSRVSRNVLVLLALGSAFYVLAGLNQSDLRPPTSSRYQLPSAIFILLIMASLLEGLRIRTPALVVAACLAVLSVFGGIKLMNEQVDSRWTPSSDSVRASLGGVDVAGAAARPDFVVDLRLEEPIPVGTYLEATGDFGSPGDSEDELTGRRADLRFSADATLIDALGLQLSGEVPVLADETCSAIETWRNARPGQTVIIRNRGRDDLGVGLSRFSDPPGAEVGSILPRSPAALALPDDESDRPWRIAVTRGGPAELCRSG